MKPFAYKLWLCIGLTSPFTLLAACNEGGSGDERAERYGTLQLPLGAIGANGNRYRLRGAELVISGAASHTLSSENSLDQDTVQLELPAGSFAVELRSGWFLERETAMGFTPVDAGLISPAIVSFAIIERAVTHVGFQFQVGGEAVGFGDGTLSLGIGVTEIEAGIAGAGGSGGTSQTGGTPGSGAGAGGTMSPGAGMGSGGNAGSWSVGGETGEGGARADPCGDGTLQGGEECDDGNSDPCDGCVACREFVPAPGSIVVPPVIATDTVWCAGQAPVQLRQNSVVLQGATLFVGPGTRVEADDGLGLQVRGGLRVHGSEAAPVVFTSASTTGTWSGLSVVGDDAVVEHALLEYARTALSFASLPCCDTLSSAVQNVIMRHNFHALDTSGTYGLEQMSGLSVIDNVQGIAGRVGLIENSEFQRNALFAVASAETIRNSLFVHNGLSAERADRFGLAVYTAGTIETSRLVNNGIAIGTAGTVRNSELIGNSLAIERLTGGVEHSLFADNGGSVHALQATLTSSTLVRNGGPITLDEAGHVQGSTLCNAGDFEIVSRTHTSASATGNWWCSTDPAVIAERIFDVFDDVGVGPIEFTPFLAGPPLGAPPDPGPAPEGPPRVSTCRRIATSTNPWLVDMEGLTDPNEVFGNRNGFWGSFNGYNNFVLSRTAGNAHSGKQALSASGDHYSQVALAPSTCIDLSAFSAVTFWAKGTGELGVYANGGFGLGPLSETYRQYTVLLRDIGIPSTVLDPSHALYFIAQLSPGIQTSLFLDDISFVSLVE